MPAPFEGGCLCGAVRFEVSSEPVAFMLCHCRDCQYFAGGEPAAIVVASRPDFSLKQGHPKGYTVKGESGNEVECQFCPECGTSLFERLGGMPHLWGIMAGTLDDPGWLKPTAFLWQKSAQPWAHRDPSIHAFEKGPQSTG